MIHWRRGCPVACLHTRISERKKHDESRASSDSRRDRNAAIVCVNDPLNGSETDARAWSGGTGDAEERLEDVIKSRLWNSRP
jgi:hypothetical protein